MTVSSQMQGAARITLARVESGDTVKKGEVLFKLDPTAALLVVKQAQAGVSAAAATLRQAKNDDKSDAEIAQDAAALDQANLQVKIAQVQAGYSIITSPIDAVALDVPATVGENAAPGGTLAVLGDVKHLTVSVYVPESRIGRGQDRPVRHADDRLVDEVVRLQGHVRRLAGRVHAGVDRDEGPARQARLRGQARRLGPERHAQAGHAGGREPLACPSRERTHSKPRG